MQQRTKLTTRALRDGPPYRAVWWRFVLALCASFMATGYLAALSHMTFVVHARCAEHGELVHVDGGARSGAEGRSARTAAPSIGEGTAVSEDEHDHCLLATAQLGQARVAEADHRIVPHDDPPVAAPAPAPRPAKALVPPPPPIAILLLSPKGSPPA